MFVSKSMVELTVTMERQLEKFMKLKLSKSAKGCQIRTVLQLNLTDSRFSRILKIRVWLQNLYRNCKFKEFTWILRKRNEVPLVILWGNIQHKYCVRCSTVISRKLKNSHTTEADMESRRSKYSAQKETQ